MDFALSLKFYLKKFSDILLKELQWNLSGEMALLRSIWL